MTNMDLPDVLDLRLIDGSRHAALQDAIERRDRSRIIAIVTDALKELSRADLRRWPGRFNRADWAVRAQRSLHSLQLRLLEESRPETPDTFPLWEDVDIAAPDLLCAFAMPWFQGDYLLDMNEPNDQWHAISAAARDYPVKVRHSTLEFETAQEGIDFFRVLCNPNASKRKLTVRVKDVEPCSFVGLGFLDGGGYRRLLTDRSEALSSLLDAAQHSKLCFEDVMWLAPPVWLANLSELLRRGELDSDLLQRIAKLGDTAKKSGLQIAVSGTFGSDYSA